MRERERARERDSWHTLQAHSFCIGHCTGRCEQEVVSNICCQDAFLKTHLDRVRICFFSFDYSNTQIVCIIL